MIKEEYVCNHNPNTQKNTLEIINKMEMIYPMIYYFQCCKCKQFFKFKKKDNEFIDSEL